MINNSETSNTKKMNQNSFFLYDFTKTYHPANVLTMHYT